jgi:hypothetical protein
VSGKEKGRNARGIENFLPEETLPLPFNSRAELSRDLSVGSRTFSDFGWFRHSLRRKDHEDTVAVGIFPKPVDLAVVVTPALTVAHVIGECVDAGVKAAVASTPKLPCMRLTKLSRPRISAEQVGRDHPTAS